MNTGKRNSPAVKTAKTPAGELGCLARHRAYLGLPPKRGSRHPFAMPPEQVFAAQVDGLCRRLGAINCRNVVLGISGGLDSTLALLVVEEAFTRLGYGKDGIHAFTMPGFGTSRRTKGNAGALCEGLGIGLGTVDIRPACRRHFKDIGHDGKTADITYENVQARMRTLVLMNKANMTGGIVIGTGDMSEIALGWCTYNGDHMSMFAVNSGVPKTVVR
jgi:NAD+ synthase (glutamine-hydrolysing)